MSVEIRPIGDAELDLWVSIPNRIIPTPQTAEEVRAYREAVEQDEYLLAFAGGEPLGAAQISLEPQRASRSLALGFVCVLPEGRGRGLGSALHADLAAWAMGRGLVALEGYVIENDGESLAWTSRRGYVEVGRDSWLALDLTRAEVPPVNPRFAQRFRRRATGPRLLHGEPTRKPFRTRIPRASDPPDAGNSAKAVYCPKGAHSLRPLRGGRRCLRGTARPGSPSAHLSPARSCCSDFSSPSGGGRVLHRTGEAKGKAGPSLPS